MKITGISGTTILELDEGETNVMEEGGQPIEAVKDRLWRLGYPKLNQKLFTLDGTDELDDDVLVKSGMELLLVMMTSCPSDKKFMSACSSNRISKVEKLLQKGQDPNTRDPDRQKWAIHAAASKGHSQAVQLLVQARANLEAIDANGSTALHLAVRQRGLPHWLCHWSVVQVLIEAAANLEAREARGLTALHLAACTGRLEIVRLLVESGANKDATDPSGITALQLAQFVGRKEIVGFLTQAADAEGKVDGFTSRHTNKRRKL